MSRVYSLPPDHSVVVWDTETVQRKSHLAVNVGLAATEEEARRLFKEDKLTKKQLTDAVLSRIHNIHDVLDAKKAGLAAKHRYADASMLKEALYKAERRAPKTGVSFGDWMQHKVCALSAVWWKVRRGGVVNGNWIIEDLTFQRVLSYGEGSHKEKNIMPPFLADVEKHRPQMVTHNGSGYDLPLMEFGQVLARLREEEDKRLPEARHFQVCLKPSARNAAEHERWHVDSIHAWSKDGLLKFPKLDVLAQNLGWPGKMGVSGSGVLEMFLRKKFDDIRAYCECDVLNTDLNHRMWLFGQNILPWVVFDRSMEQTLDYLATEGKDRPHLAEFRRLLLENNRNKPFLKGKH